MQALTPPSQPTGAFSDGIRRWRGDDLLRFYGFDQGIAIVKRNGTWTTSTVVSQDLDEEFYQGGMVHIITDAKADELTAAGFGAYIGPVPDSVYGAGGYGAGGFI